MTAPAPRLHLRCALDAGPPVERVGLRPMVRSDAPALGRLFYAAYLGSVDYEGESEADALAVVTGTFDGEYGAWIAPASMLLEEAGQPVSASVVTTWQGRPLLAFAVTHPARKNEGLSRTCTTAAMQALARAGHRELYLFVTGTNAPACALYRRLGFLPVHAG
jgi:ribosomal protein S18 acetylase RimI-like enzyme